MLKATSSAVTSDPSWNFTPFLSLKVQVFPSFEAAQLSARCAWMSPVFVG